MSEDQKPIRIDSRAWTGDPPDPADQQKLPWWLKDDRKPLPPINLGSAIGIMTAHFIMKKIDPKSDVLGSYKYQPAPRIDGHTPAILLAGPLFLIILSMALGIFIDTDFGYFGGYYLASKADWQEKLPFSFALLTIICVIILLATKFVTLPNWTNCACALIGLGLIVMSAADYWWVVQAHRNAKVVAPMEPILLADGNGCGRKFSFLSRHGPPDPGPCVHGFRAMSRKGEHIWFIGKGMATERACVLVQKLSDGHGFVWYRRGAYHDLLPEIGGAFDFPADLGRSCLNGTMMAQFSAPL